MMPHDDLSQDVFRARLQAVIESLRYWIPQIADAARVEELEAPGYWKLTVTPRTTGACPLELMLRSDRRFDIMIGGETFEDLELLPLEDFLPLVEAVTSGSVLQRRRSSPSTGAPLDVKTIVTLANGKTWTAARTLMPGADKIPDEDFERHDRHFLPYRR